MSGLKTILLVSGLGVADNPNVFMRFVFVGLG